MSTVTTDMETLFGTEKLDRFHFNLYLCSALFKQMKVEIVKLQKFHRSVVFKVVLFNLSVLFNV